MLVQGVVHNYRDWGSAELLLIEARSKSTCWASLILDAKGFISGVGRRLSCFEEGGNICAKVTTGI